MVEVTTAFGFTTSYILYHLCIKGICNRWNIWKFGNSQTSYNQKETKNWRVKSDKNTFTLELLRAAKKQHICFSHRVINLYIKLF